MKRRPTHYAEILARTNRVINVSWAALNNYRQYNDKVPWEEKIYFRLPGNRFRIIEVINKNLYGMFLKAIVYTLPQKPILWHFYSGNYDIIKSLPKKLSILEICDDTPEFFSNNVFKYNEVKRKEDQMTKSVDIVFTISDYLKQRRQILRPDIMVIRNGVIYEDFSPVPFMKKNQIDELYNMNSPVVGYTGAVSNWFDFDLVEEVAKKLTKVNFVFIGRISSEKKEIINRLNKYSNIHFIGERKYEELPNYMKYFDLCHIPFVTNDLVASVNPIKLYEYLAAGKRVVSTPMPELVRYQKDGIIEIADDIVSYSEVIEKILENGTSDSIMICQKIGRNNTWESRVNEACNIVEQIITKG